MPIQRVWQQFAYDEKSFSYDFFAVNNKLDFDFECIENVSKRFWSESAFFKEVV